MTVTVETPEGLKSGSAVREINVVYDPGGLGVHPGGQASAKGEAVVVDLGNRGVLYALINVDEYHFIFSTFPGPPGLSREGINYYNNLRHAKAELDKNNYVYPILVTFKNVNDPMSLQAVYKVRGGEIIENRISEIFGDGVKLHSIEIEMTDKPVTRGMVDKYLPNRFEEYISKNWANLSNQNQHKLFELINFKEGEF